MSLQKEDMITKQAPEQHMEEENSQWILGSLMTISKIESLSASIATSMDIWQRSSKQRRRNKKYERILNATRKGILPKTAKRKVQEESDNEDNNKEEQGFGEDLE